MRMQMRAGGGQAEIRLAPEFLGSVRLSVVVDHGVVKATLSADSPGALESLPWDVDRLRASLESHGLHLDEFELRDDPYGSSPQESSAEHQREEERPRRQPQLATPARGLGFGEVFDVIA
jgi:flagellar hook-length control protein FliK